jgi:hypothetical protein
MKTTIRELGLAGVLAVCAAVLLLPVGGLMALDAFGIFDLGGTGVSRGRGQGDAPPAWMNTLNFVAPTSDGHPVTLEVSIDAPDRATMRALSADTAQLTVLLKLQVGSMPSRELKAPGGIQRLSERMLGALRERVGDDDGRLVRQVAIGNLVVRTP